VRIDASMLEQAILNLAVNARDAMDRGGRLTFRTHAEEADGKSWVVLSVTDTGCGMTQETADRIFEPFFTTKAESKGTGLGLAMVHGFVTQSGGRITVASVPDRGTTFELRFPRVDEPQSDDAAGGPNDARAGAPQGRGRKVLVVEDEELVRRLAELILTEDGFDVTCARSGAEALELIDGMGPLALLITDLVLPGMDGNEVAERILRRQPDVPVVFTSGYAEDDVVARIEWTERTTFLPKPLTPATLRRAVRHVSRAT